MRPLLLALITLAALAAVPSPALAKGIVAGQACGADGCSEITQDKLHALAAEGDRTDPPATAKPFVEIRLKMFVGPNGQTDRSAFDYLPSLGVTRPHDGGDGGAWIALTPQARRALDTAVATTKPRSANELAQIAGLPTPAGASGDDGVPRWAIAGGALAVLALLTLALRHTTSALKARPRASKSAN